MDGPVLDVVRVQPVVDLRATPLGALRDSAAAAATVKRYLENEDSPERVSVAAFNSSI